MSYDGIVTHFVVEELKEKLIGGKINKINQPDRNEIHMIVYNNRKNYRLLLGVSSNIPRVYITEENRNNPLTAPNFCMFLRKQIQSGKEFVEAINGLLKLFQRAENETQSSVGLWRECGSLSLADVMAGPCENIPSLPMRTSDCEWASHRVVPGN